MWAEKLLLSCNVEIYDNGKLVYFCCRFQPQSLKIYSKLVVRPVCCVFHALGCYASIFEERHLGLIATFG